MSYYGYPNPQAYNAANYQAYAAAYAATGTNPYANVDQFAAYNAYRAMQTASSVPGGVPPPPPPPPPQQQQLGGSKPSASISQPAQRYDYSSLMQQNTNNNNTNNQTGYDANAYASNMMTSNNNNMQPQSYHHQHNNNQNQNKTPQQAKWNSMLAAVGGGMKQKQQSNNQFNRNNNNNRSNRNPSGQPVQIFYCEVCKISCAGPQTYKEHLDGQKHKKREQASKLSNEQTTANAAAAATTNTATGPVPNNVSNNQNNNNNNNWKQRGNGNGRNQSSFSRNSIVIKCELCDVACTGRDAYTAHVRGMKHQKTLKLHQKLGKPIPPDALDILHAAANVLKTITPTMTMSAPVTYPQPNVITAGPIVTKPVVAATATPAAATIATPTIAPTQPVVAPLLPPPLLSNNNNNNEALMPEENNNNNNNNNHQMMDDQDDQLNIEPIGREYIETRLEGKILSFYCKLCECQFNDPNAKDMHTKGRRHRLAYKKKVDPSLRVDMKSSNSNNSRLKDRNRRNMPVSHSPSNNNQIASSTETTNNNAPTGGIMPLMSATPLADGTQIPAQQTIQQLMSQPLKMVNTNNQQNNTGSNYNWSFGNNNNTNNNFQASRQGESFDDRHVISKHNSIYPSQEEISAIQEIVNCTEKALKLVSDQIAEEDALEGVKKAEVITQSESTPTSTNSAVAADAATSADQQKVQDTSDQQAADQNESTKDHETPNQMYRALKGVMRVGLLAKGLLLKGDTDVQLIVLCADKPTKRLLERVYIILLKKIDIVSPQIKYSILLDKLAETIVIIRTTISDLQPLITCKVLLTSPAVRTSEEQQQQQANQTELTVPLKSELTNKINENNDDLLDKQRCLDSLASLRHSKWFQARASNVNNCVVIIRILRDLCRRNPTWSPLSQWGLELLVERSLSSSNQPLSPGEALRRVLECVSSGILLPSGCGLYDPCEKDPTDVSDVLKNQQREELTSSAQMALRLLAFKQIHKILGMECLPSNSSNNLGHARGPRKRHYQSTGNDSQIEEKKERKDTTEAESAGSSIVENNNVEIKMESTTN